MLRCMKRTMTSIESALHDLALKFSRSIVQAILNSTFEDLETFLLEGQTAKAITKAKKKPSKTHQRGGVVVNGGKFTFTRPDGTVVRRSRERDLRLWMRKNGFS